MQAVVSFASVITNLQLDKHKLGSSTNVFGTLSNMAYPLLHCQTLLQAQAGKFQKEVI